MSKKLTIILGPTAVGKTAYSISLAKKIGCPVINCDSRQIFKELNIGVARPSVEELSQVKHYFIASHSVKDNYTAGRFEVEALELLRQLFEDYDHLVMTGGSGFYIDALCSGLDDFPAADLEIRNQLMTRLETEGLESLQEELKRIDPDSYDAIDIANRQRVVRALEVTLATGKKFSEWKTSPKKKRPFDIEKIGLDCPREILYDRINRRVDVMMENGLLDEVKGLVEYRNLPALKTVGYKELFKYLDGKCSLEEAVTEIKKNTRHYAKKQMTYWSRDKEIKWINYPAQTGI
ncbi:MAG: tRNA (adenosine(37)-N6)-dimethylallyltransferase MiaA [Bacteroidales bacterium]|nr:tRNA (adenosine(37)-N6)-dimethylallyltransferase MiaA [Bacteroidales bacterium]